MKIVAMIPARLASNRFPGKVLEQIDGLPMVGFIARRVALCPMLGQSLVATGNPEILLAMEKLGIETIVTTRDLPSGTDRLAEANQIVDADIVVNIQGDEPLVEPGHLQRLIEALRKDPEAAASTLRYPLRSAEATNPNIVKVVVDRRGRALYFSRRPLAQEPDRFFKHLGMYAYRRKTLELFRTLPVAPTERAERLEQLRLLHGGLPMAVADAPADTIGVDTPGDLERVRRWIGEMAK